MADNRKKAGRLLDDDASFALLRVNPKLTGNVKVVVDSDSNLYLDTFKVSLGLSQNKYRHIPLNPSVYYGRTLMDKMKDIPTDDFYKIDESCYDLFANASDLNGQYYDTYNCGVRTNIDKMYSENFSMLAPLCIRKNLPDFFLIFRIDNYEDTVVDTSYGDIRFNNTDFLSINKSTLIKSFDLREGTNLGTYIRNILEGYKGFVGDVYTGMTYDHFNGYNGISLDKGVVSSVYESTVDERMFNSQVAMNNNYTLGFQRNHLVAKDIVNFEFMFDDPDSNLFSLQTYFGIYVRLNKQYDDFSCIGSNGGINMFDTIPAYNDSSSYFNPLDASGNLDKIIYGLSSPDGFERLEQNIYTSSAVKKYAMKPDDVVFTADIVETSNLFDNDHDLYAYASLVLNEPLNPGEHYKIIDEYNRRNIYEVIISSLVSDRDISNIEVFDVDCNGTYKNYRIFINNVPNKGDIPESDIQNVIQKQLDLLVKAFNSFSSNEIDAYSDNKNTFSIVCKASSSGHGSFADKLTFVQVLSTDDTNNTSYKSAHIFGVDEFYKSTQYSVLLQPEQENGKFNKYFPNGFEYLGERTCYAVQFVSIVSIYYHYGTTFFINKAFTDNSKKNDTLLFKTRSGEYEIAFGSSTIGPDYTKYIEETDTIQNPEFSSVIVDHEEKILWGKYSNGDSTNIDLSGLYIDNIPVQRIIDALVLGQETDGQINLKYLTLYQGDPSFANLAQCTISGAGSTTCYLVQFNYGADENAGKIQIYKNSMLNYGICSILNIKDFDHAVIDYKNQFVIKGGTGTDKPEATDYDDMVPISQIPGFYQEKNKAEYCEETIMNYIDQYESFDVSTNNKYGTAGRCALISDDALSLYLDNLQKNAHYKFDISLLAPYCCKWRGLATDVKGYQQKVMSAFVDNKYETLEIKPYIIENGQIGGNPKSYFVASQSDLIGFSTNDQSNSETYIQDLLDVVNGMKDPDSNLSVDDILFSSDHKINRFSKVYKYGKNDIEFVACGLKIRLSSNNATLIDFSKYVGYSIVFARCEESNETNRFELTIDEINEQMLLVVYGNDLTLSGFKASKNNITVYIKKSDNTITDAITYNNGIRMDFVDYVDVQRENTNYKITTYGYYHTCISSPMMTDILSFYYDEQVLDGYDDVNKLMYDGANVRLYDINFVTQSWLKKYIEIDAEIGKSAEQTQSDFVTTSLSYDIRQVPGPNEDRIPIYSPYYRYYDANGNGYRILNRKDVEYEDDPSKPIFIINPGSARISPLQGTDWYCPIGIHLYRNNIINAHFYLDASTQTYYGEFELSNDASTKGVNVGQTYYLYSSRIHGTAQFEDVSRYNEFAESYNTHLYIYKIHPDIGDLYSISLISSDGYYDGYVDSSDNIFIRYPSDIPDSDFDTIIGDGIGFSLSPIPVSSDWELDEFICYFINNGSSSPAYILDKSTSINTFFTINDKKYEKKAIAATLEIDAINLQSNLPNPEGDSTMELRSSSSWYFPNIHYKHYNDDEENGDVHRQGYKTESTTTYTYLSPSVSLSKYVHPLHGYWYTEKICRLFNGYDNFNGYFGYYSGYEKNMYLASRGLILKGLLNSVITDRIIITDWINVTADSTTKTITIDVTGSLSDYIMKSVGYRNTWDKLLSVAGSASEMGITSSNKESFMKKYIENSIINNITIDENTKFTLYVDYNNAEKLRLGNGPINKENVSIVNNVKNTLVFENNRYYMVIRDLENYKYYAEMYINLM